MKQGYKFITAEMKSKHGDSGVWKIGEWKEWDGPLRMCETGFHFSKDAVDSLDYAHYGEVLCLVEYRDEGETEGTKTVCRKMRVVKTVDLRFGKILVENDVEIIELNMSDIAQVRYPKKAKEEGEE